VLAGQVSKASVPVGKAITTLQGGFFKIDANGTGLQVTDGRNRNSNIVQTDLNASNGVVHVIDKVLLPADKNIVQTALALPDFSILAEAVVAANLQDAHNLFSGNYNSVEKAVTYLSHPWQIMQWNREWLLADFNRITANRFSEPIPESVQCVNAKNIFIEHGAQIMPCWLNASEGPIYIGKDAYIMEGSAIRGPFAMGEGSVLKMHTSIYGATTVGPFCTAGGEIKNVVMMGYSNKAHQGYLGDSVIGEWCNLGADSNNSNLKNNYSEVKVWNYPAQDYIGTGLQFCGLFMGDHSKCSINTMFNTGTVVGVFANIFGAGFPAKYVPSFSWGSDSGGEVFIIDKALQLAEKVMSRRNIPLTEADKNILTHLYMMQLQPKAED
jgi:UDP-N-acetylglucosamine diphosphorylase/glucosamine-1-phosphate N-acetyltransferase